MINLEIKWHMLQLDLSLYNNIPNYFIQMNILCWINITCCHTAIENLSDPIGYLHDFTNPYYMALAGNMKARAKKDNSFWNHT
jgi:hypothetical protein